MVLTNPFKIAASVRYSYDEDHELNPIDINQFYHVESYYSNIGLKVSSDVTPDIYKNLKTACSRLRLPINKVRAFIISRHEINAHCVSFQKKGCIIALYSELINIMSPGEIEFIIGHEIGHFLMNHNYFDNDPKITEEESIRSRAGEISSDRIGLIACNNVDIAIKAMIRIQSGLSDQFLRFDTGAFLSQMKTEKQYREHLHKTTHPSATIRAKALLRFSLSEPYQRLKNNVGGTKLSTVDKHIKKDLDGYFKEKNDSFFESWF